MKKLLLAMLVAAQLPAAIAVSNVYATKISHGAALINFTVTGSTVDDSGTQVYWKWLKVCWSTTAGACAANGGTVMPTGYPSAAGSSLGPRSNSVFSVILSGFTPSSTIEVCPQVSQDNTTFVQGCGTFTSLGKPAIHPVVAELPRNTVVPTAPAEPYVNYHTTSSNGNGVISGTTYPATTCANLQFDMDYAQSVQNSYGTVIALTPGQANKCADRYYFRNNPPDVHTFSTGDVNTSANTIAWSGSGLTEGHGVQFGQNYSNLPGQYGTDPNDCTGIKPGQVYYAHFTNFGSDPNHFQLTCSYPYPQGRVMKFDVTQGWGGSNMYVAPYPRQLYPIVLRTATPDSQLPPPGVRINPSWSSKLAVLQPEALCTGYNCQYKSVGVRKTAALAFGDLFDDGDLRMVANIFGIGLEIQSIDDTGDSAYDPMPTWNLLTFKQGTSDNILDRCYIHGQYPFPNRLAWGIVMDGHGNGITNSYFDRITYPFHNSGDTSYQTEGTQFFQAATGPGPYIIYNNFMQTTGNGMHFNGGGDGGFFNTYAQDILIRRNTITQNPPDNHQQYCSGNPGADSWEYRNRQPLEFKGAWRALVDGNIFEYDCHWLASVSLAVTSVTGGVFDITAKNNTWRHVSAGLTAGSSTQGGQIQIVPTSRYNYTNNLFWDMDGCKYIDHQSNAYSSGHGYCWNGLVIQAIQDGEDTLWQHNTVVSTAGFVPGHYYLGPGAEEGFKATDSIIYAHSDANLTGWGARVDGGNNQEQARTCNGFISEPLMKCDWKFPLSTVAGNLITSDTLTNSQITDASTGLWKTQKTTATPSNLSLVGWASIGNNDYRYAANSPYISGGSSPASDGLDEGANILELERAQGRVYMGSVIPASTSATISFVAPDTQSCPVDVSSSDSSVIASFTRVTDTNTNVGPRSITIPSLTAHTSYWFRLNCAVQQPVGYFSTN